jgi:transposase
MKTRRKYDPEFKQMAVELSKHRNDISALAEELEIKPDLLYRWRREALGPQGTSFPGQGNPKQTPEEKEIARLKKELREAQLERDILKKAVSIFSKSDGKYSNS